MHRFYNWTFAIYAPSYSIIKGKFKFNNCMVMHGHTKQTMLINPDIGSDDVINCYKV